MFIYILSLDFFPNKKKTESVFLEPFPEVSRHGKTLAFTDWDELERKSRKSIETIEFYQLFYNVKDCKGNFYYLNSHFTKMMHS